MHADVERLKEVTRIPLNGTGPTGPGCPSPVVERLRDLDESEEINGPDGPEPVQFPPVQGYRIAEDGIFELPQTKKKSEVQLTLSPCGVVAHCRDGRRENWGAY
jgi:hypothetical protein